MTTTTESPTALARELYARTNKKRATLNWNEIGIDEAEYVFGLAGAIYGQDNWTWDEGEGPARTVTNAPAYSFLIADTSVIAVLVAGELTMLRASIRQTNEAAFESALRSAVALSVLWDLPYLLIITEPAR